MLSSMDLLLFNLKNSRINLASLLFFMIPMSGLHVCMCVGMCMFICKDQEGASLIKLTYFH